MTTLRSGKTTGRDAKQSDEVSEQMALTSVQSCYRAAFLSTLVDIILTLTGESTPEWTWNYAVEWMEALNIFGVGIGLWRVFRFYRQQFMADDSSTAKTVTSDQVDFICLIMSRLWFRTGCTVLFTSLASACTLDDDTVIAIVASVSAWVFGIVMASQDDSPNGVIRNMLWCVCAFCINGLVILAETLLSSSTNLEKILGMSSVAEPLIIAGLLYVLRREMNQALVQVAREIKDGTTGSYGGLYQAQKKFYDKITSVLLKSAAIQFATPILLQVKPYVCQQNFSLVEKFCGEGE